MNSIKLNTRLGACKLKISAQVQNDKIETLAELAMQYLIWHAVPAVAYSKDSDFARENEFSDVLAKHVADSAKDVLADCFSDIEIATSEYLKPNTADKIIAGIDKMSDEDFAKLEAKAEARRAKQAAKTAKVETTVEA